MCLIYVSNAPTIILGSKLFTNNIQLAAKISPTLQLLSHIHQQKLDHPSHPVKEDPCRNSMSPDPFLQPFEGRRICSSSARSRKVRKQSHIWKGRLARTNERERERDDGHAAAATIRWESYYTGRGICFTACATAAALVEDVPGIRETATYPSLCVYG